MLKMTRFIFSSVLTISIMVLVACNGNTSGTASVNLPQEFVKCESRLTGKTFKYVEKNVFPDAFCVNQKCVDIYEITDLSGNRIILNEHEIRDEWMCSVINN